MPVRPGVQAGIWQNLDLWVESAGVITTGSPRDPYADELACSEKQS